MGNPGTGKTYLSASILNLLFEKKEEVFYTTHRRFIEEIHKAIEEGKTQHSVIDRLSYKKYLIFDDLGSSKCTEWQNEMVLELIDRRYSNENKTLITTNLNKKQISDILGERTASRIFDKKNETLEFWAKDQRQN
jgi:DNA replication protein DnaC